MLTEEMILRGARGILIRDGGPGWATRIEERAKGSRPFDDGASYRWHRSVEDSRACLTAALSLKSGDTDHA